MKAATAVLALVLPALVVAAGPSSAQAPGHARPATVSVRAFGARGDGVANDTAAVQAAVDAAPAGAAVYFPVGTYLVDDVQVNRRRDLGFKGDGAASVLKRMPRPGNTRIATFVEVTDIIISDLAFDANGIERFGGVNFYDARRVRIERTHFFDGRPQPPGPADRYAYVFGRGQNPSEDIVIAGNRIDGLQLEVDHARRVRVSDNTVVRTAGTAGIGLFTLSDEAVAEDYTIARNTIVDPAGTGLAVHVDPPVFRRIRVTGNTVIRKSTAGPSITVGTVNNSVPTRGNLFEDLMLDGNVVLLEFQGADPKGEGGVLFFNTSPRANVTFRRAVVKGNRIQAHGGVTRWGIDLRFPEQSTVDGNNVVGVHRGIVVTGALDTVVSGNTVEVIGAAYRFSDSRGGNTVAGNRVVGTPTRRWDLVRLHPSDSVDQR